ncbi:MAG: hypothetical protein PHI16_01940 [Methanocellales archaeon]|nr:hypothetical protein [Methanocellales archaeon]
MSQAFRYLDKNLNEKKLRVAPNKLLLRQCERDEAEFLISTAKVNRDDASDMYLKNLTDDYFLPVCEVLAVGERRPWSVRARRIMGVKKWFAPEVEVGDFVIMPMVSAHNRMWSGVINAYDSVADNNEILMIIKGNQNAQNN